MGYNLRGRANAGSLGLRSVFWLLLQAALAILLSLVAGQFLNIGSDATALFRELDTLDESTVSAYAGLTQPFHQVLENLFPENVVGDFANNNVPALIITGVAVAAAYLAVAKKEGEELVRPFSFPSAARGFPELRWSRQLRSSVPSGFRSGRWF